MLMYHSKNKESIITFISITKSTQMKRDVPESGYYPMQTLITGMNPVRSGIPLIIMNTHIRIGCAVLGALLVCISLIIIPVAGILVPEQTTDNGTAKVFTVTTSTEFDGTHYIVKNVDTGELLQSLTPEEFEKKRTEHNTEFRIEGPDATGMMTIYDRTTGAVVGTGFRNKTP